MSDYFTQEELQEFKKLIIEKREFVIKELTDFIENKRNENIELSRGDSADIASTEIDNISSVKLADKHRKLLSELDHALKKFDDGSYGLCEGTGEYISKKRLKAHPWTRYSVEYKEDKERKEKFEKMRATVNKWSDE